MVRVESTKRKLRLRFGVTLTAGINEIDPEAWDKCKEDPITQHYLSNQIIKVVSGSAARPEAISEPLPSEHPKEEPDTSTEENAEEEDEDTDATPHGLATMKAKDAIAFVKTSNEVELLEDLLDTEERTTVCDAIEKRLDELSD